MKSRKICLVVPKNALSFEPILPLWCPLKTRIKNTINYSSNKLKLEPFWRNQWLCAMGQTDTLTDIKTTRLNRPRGRSLKNTSFLLQRFAQKTYWEPNNSFRRDGVDVSCPVGHPMKSSLSSGSLVTSLPRSQMSAWARWLPQTSCLLPASPQTSCFLPKGHQRGSQSFWPAGTSELNCVRKTSHKRDHSTSQKCADNRIDTIVLYHCTALHCTVGRCLFLRYHCFPCGTAHFIIYFVLLILKQFFFFFKIWHILVVLVIILQPK